MPTRAELVLSVCPSAADSASRLSAINTCPRPFPHVPWPGRAGCEGREGDVDGRPTRAACRRAQRSPPPPPHRARLATLQQKQIIPLAKTHVNGRRTKVTAFSRSTASAQKEAATSAPPESPPKHGRARRGWAARERR